MPKRKEPSRGSNHGLSCRIWVRDLGSCFRSRPPYLLSLFFVAVAWNRSLITSASLTSPCLAARTRPPSAGSCNISRPTTCPPQGWTCFLLVPPCASLEPPPLTGPPTDPSCSIVGLASSSLSMTSIGSSRESSITSCRIAMSLPSYPPCMVARK